MAVVRISRAAVKRLLAAALNTAVGTELRLKSELEPAQAEVTESNRRYRVRGLTLEGQPRRHRDNEPDEMSLRLEIGVAVSSSKVYADGDDAIDDAIDVLAAVLDKPEALIDGTTRIELSRMSSADEPSGDNEAESRALVTVVGRVIKTAS